MEYIIEHREKDDVSSYEFSMPLSWKLGSAIVPGIECMSGGNYSDVEMRRNKELFK